ncbi:hypothetical protein [Streptomyces sp. NBC_00019]
MSEAATRIQVGVHPEALAETGEALRADLAEQGFETCRNVR